MRRRYPRNADKEITMSARMRIVPLPRDEYGVIFDRTSESSSLPPRLPVLDDNGRVTGSEPVDLKPVLGARFIVWFEDEIDLDNES